jgi:hypothetical protein
MRTYETGVIGAKVRTASKRRYLLVSVYDRRATVETTTDNSEAAARLLAGYRRDFGHSKWLIIDQAFPTTGPR